MLSQTLLQKLNNQYAHEKTNQLIYESMASAMDFQGFTGASKFLSKQAEGEAGHAKAVYDYIVSRNDIAHIGGLELPEIQNEFYACFEQVMQVEIGTTESLKEIASIAFTEGDYQTFYWIADLIKEQTEEENISQTILDRLGSCGKTKEMTHHYDLWIAEL